MHGRPLSAPITLVSHEGEEGGLDRRPDRTSIDWLTGHWSDRHSLEPWVVPRGQTGGTYSLGGGPVVGVAVLYTCPRVAFDLDSFTSSAPGRVKCGSGLFVGVQSSTSIRASRTGLATTAAAVAYLTFFPSRLPPAASPSDTQRTSLPLKRPVGCRPPFNSHAHHRLICGRPLRRASHEPDESH
nr:hypothetical protein CFP56_12312 [Quercus suber]